MAKQITTQVRGYNTAGDRRRAIAQLAKQGFDHFVCFKDVQSDYALMYGVKTWDKGRVYVCR